MAHLVPILNPLRPRVLAADSTPMTTQLLVGALEREGQFQMIESPSSAGAILALVKKEKPQVALISAKLGDPGVGAFDLVGEFPTQPPGPRELVSLHSRARTRG